MAIIVSCGGSDTITSMYFAAYIASTNIDVSVDLPPSLTGGLSDPPATATLLTDTPGIAQWSFTAINPAPMNGTWVPGTSYGIGDTVGCGPATYRSLQALNLGHSPQIAGIEMMNGWWTNECTPVFGPGVSIPKSGFGYLLASPYPTDLSALNWHAGLGHSLFWNVAPPGDIVNLYDLVIRVNYASGRVVDLRPLNVTSVPGTEGYILIPGTAAQYGCTPGVTAQFQCYHTSGVSSTPVLTASAWQQIPADVDTVTVGDFYTSTITASGGTGPYTFSFTGEFPPGVGLNSATGVVSGTVADGGLYSATITATDSLGNTGFTTCGILADCGCSGTGGFGNVAS